MKESYGVCRLVKALVDFVGLVRWDSLGILLLRICNKRNDRDKNPGIPKYKTASYGPRILRV